MPRLVAGSPTVSRCAQVHPALLSAPAPLSFFAPPLNPCRPTRKQVAHNFSRRHFEPLVSRAGSRFTVRFCDDRVGVFGPDEGLAAFVPAIDERGDGLDQLAHGTEACRVGWLAG